MNLKHEMFWNSQKKKRNFKNGKWTLNMKCFEIWWKEEYNYTLLLWTLNMKCFEIKIERAKYVKEQ